MLEVKQRDKVAISYKENGEVKATFYVIPLSPFQLKKIMEKCRTVNWDAPTKRGEKKRFVEPDIFQLTFERIDKTIVDWDGVTRDGDVLPCTRDNKLFVYENATHVINYVMDEADKLLEMEIERDEDELKNSEAGHHGTLPQE